MAHFGRGRGEWSQSEHPEHWRNELLRVLSSDAANLPKASDAELVANRPELESEFKRCVNWATEQVLLSLYPGSKLSEKLA